jgi:peptide deformylase
MIYGIDTPDQLIYEAIDKFDFQNPPVDPIVLADDLAQTMLANNGIGLAANQCGLPYRVFAIRGEQVIVCFNPIIVDSSKEQVYLEEGCLSFPNLFIKVKRPANIKVRYTEPNGNVVTQVFKGLTSRIFQHELDHLDGVTYQQRASTLNLDKARQQKKKYDRRSKSNAS